MMLNFDFVLRLLVAGILGAIIGLDREYRAKEAGYRTHFLVSLGSEMCIRDSGLGIPQAFPQLPSVIESPINKTRGPLAWSKSDMQKKTITKSPIRFMAFSC